MAESTEAIEIRLLAIVREFLQQLEHERALRAVDIDASIERDLGIDSLGRVELFSRIEKAFTIHLPESFMVEADTLRDLVRAIQEANPPLKYFAKELKPTLKKAKIDLSTTNTLVDVLVKYGLETPDRPHIYLQGEGLEETTITYGELFGEATTVAKGLQAKGIRPGETVAIMLPTSSDFFYAFFGALFAGAVPVPIYPPFRPDKIEEYTKREAAILRNAEARVLITFRRVETLGKLLRSLIPSMHFVTSVKDLMQEQADYQKPSLSHDDVALIQYTSGSTGTPKGVQLGHNNLLANIRAYGDTIGALPTDVVVSWLPLYHDMGLIGAWLGSMYYGLPLTIMSPLSFLARPERWLWTIHYHRATLSAAPNFAYELCIRRIEDSLIEGLDLSSWRLAFNGAEAVYPDTLKRFTKKFAPYGFNPKALAPVYGLAESSVALLFPPLGRGPWIDRVAREPLETEDRAIPLEPSQAGGVEFVSCGKPMTGHAVRIVNEKGEALGERQVGNLQFTGPSSLQGYYRNLEATKSIYHEGWWDTGDLAYSADGEIFLTGRKKDVIIKAGRNLYPEEVEAITATISGVRKGCVVAFGISDPKHGTENFIIVAESRKTGTKAKQEISAKIIEAVLTATGIAPDQVIIAEPRTILKTSSGKLRRSGTKEDYLKGKLTRRGVPTWLQMSKLFLAGTWKSLSDWLRKSTGFIYAGYIVLLLLITAIPTWLCILILPEKISRKITRLWAKVFMTLAGCPIKTIGKENIPKGTNFIYVSNHASYADSVVLIAVLPDNISFIGKKELLTTPIIRTFFKNLGQLTVERMDFTQSVADVKILVDGVKAGLALVIFPEGTFTYATGLRPFKTGAFKIAVDTNTPICPISIKGTRQILRSNSWLPRPGPIEVTISKLIYPEGKDWQAVTQLKTLARTEIAKYCGEFPIDLIAAGPEADQKKP